MTHRRITSRLERRLAGEAVCLAIALTAMGCGSSSYSPDQPLAPTPLPSGERSATMLQVTGRMSLTTIGETSQLRVLATWPDGNARDVTASVRWNSHDSSVVTVSSSGLATAVGFGAARIDAGYESLNNTFQMGVSPSGTFAVTGEVREPGQGPLADVRVSEPLSGRSTITGQSGAFTLAGLASTRVRFAKDAYEPGELDITPNSTGFMKMQRVVRIMAGETAVVPKLTHMDMSYDVGPDQCAPCRLIRIVAPAAGTMHFDLAWEPNPGSELHLWVAGRRFSGAVDARQLAVDAGVSTGENVVYVGYHGWKVIYGSSIALTLATSMNR